MVPGENKNNAYAKFEGTIDEYYGILRTSPLSNSQGSARKFLIRDLFGPF